MRPGSEARRQTVRRARAPPVAAAASAARPCRRAIQRLKKDIHSSAQADEGRAEVDEGKARARARRRGSRSGLAFDEGGLEERVAAVVERVVHRDWCAEVPLLGVVHAHAALVRRRHARAGILLGLKSSSVTRNGSALSRAAVTDVGAPAPDGTARRAAERAPIRRRCASGVTTRSAHGRRRQRSSLPRRERQPGATRWRTAARSDAVDPHASGPSTAWDLRPASQRARTRLALPRGERVAQARGRGPDERQLVALAATSQQGSRRPARRGAAWSAKRDRAESTWAGLGIAGHEPAAWVTLAVAAGA